LYAKKCELKLQSPQEGGEIWRRIYPVRIKNVSGITVPVNTHDPEIPMKPQIKKIKPVCF
jgi:hypothetical protein